DRGKYASVHIHEDARRAPALGHVPCLTNPRSRRLATRSFFHVRTLGARILLTQRKAGNAGREHVATRRAQRRGRRGRRRVADQLRETIFATGTRSGAPTS